MVIDAENQVTCQKGISRVAIHVQITNFLLASRDTATVHGFGEHVPERDRVDKSVFIPS